MKQVIAHIQVTEHLIIIHLNVWSSIHQGVHVPFVKCLLDRYLWFTSTLEFHIKISQLLVLSTNVT